MAVYSMTGFASGRQTVTPGQDSRADPSEASNQITIEMRSVNNRYLDVVLRVPDEWRLHENALRQRITSHLKRGKVELRASLQKSNASQLPRPSHGFLEQLAQLHQSVHVVMPGAPNMSVAEVLQLSAHHANAQGADTTAPFLALADTVINDLVDAREREGARLHEALQERIVALRQLVTQASPLIPQIVEIQKQRFLTRWQDAMGAADSQIPSAAANERAMTEAAALALRADVAEELDRLRAHLDEIESILARGGEVGKRLDFLIQELHREANTLGSKSPALDLSRIGIDMKVLIEQMREQVQNLV